MQESLQVLDGAEQTNEIISLKSMAWFTLGNVLAAMQRWEEAIVAYCWRYQIGQKFRLSLPRGDLIASNRPCLRPDGQ